MYSIFTNKKGFEDYWLGNHFLNKMDLHVKRVKMADRANGIRRALAFADDNEWSRLFVKNGFVAVPDFLPKAEFAQLAEYVKNCIEESKVESPILPPSGRGFGKKVSFKGGFDRYDGGTLNRFLEIDLSETSPIDPFMKSEMLNSLCKVVSGSSFDKQKLQIYLNVNGEENTNPDLQKLLHRDSFHNVLKYWYFLEDVEPNDGPFAYVPGSHIMTTERLAWERKKALQACGVVKKENGKNYPRSGSFRIDDVDLAQLGLPQAESIVVPANTLVLADTNGFHRRGDAKIGTHRMALYGWKRPWPFGVKGW